MIQNIIKDSNARVTVNRDFFVLEKSGRRHEVDLLNRQLKPLASRNRSFGANRCNQTKMNITDLLAEFVGLTKTNENYFNTLNLREQLAQLGQCRFMGR